MSAEHPAAQDQENALVYALRHIVHWPYDVNKTPEEDLREIKDFAERTLGGDDLAAAKVDDLLARNRKLWLALECAADLLGNDGYADDPDYRQEWQQISEVLQDA